MHDMNENQVASTTLRVLHYATPILTMAYLMLARTTAKCLLHRPSKRNATASARYTAIAVLSLVTVTEVLQAVSHFVESFVRPGRWATQDRVIYILGSVFLYGSIAIGLLSNKRPLWHPILGTVCVALVLEIPLAAVQATVEPLKDRYAASRTALHVARCLILTSACGSGFWIALKNRRRLETRQSDEHSPLLANGTHGDANGYIAKPTVYGSIVEETVDSASTVSVDSNDSSSPQHMKELKAQQQSRLKQAGSWVGYLKGFKIFLPMLLPGKRERLAQACLGVIGVVLIANRFLNVLVPRQLGIITNELAESGGNGVFPRRDVAVWMLLTWLNSAAGIDLLRAFAELPLEQFARKQISSKAFAHVMNLDMNFHSDKNSGELIRAIEQGQALQNFLVFICFDVFPMLTDLCVAFWYVSTLFDVTMSYILIVVGVVYIWVGAKTNTWATRTRSRRNAAWRNESKVQNEAINNWQTVSHFNRMGYECERYDTSVDELNHTELGYHCAFHCGAGLQSFVMLLGRLSATSLAVYRVSQGEASLGNLVTLTAYWSSIQSPLVRASWSFRRATIMLTDSERLLQLFSTKANVTDAPAAVDLHVASGHVEFEHVEFAYDPRKPTLKDISFVAKPGQTVAFVGETGGGKSTILKLLYRYYDIASGVIRIDGQDIRAVTLDSLRNTFGMVPQDPALFNITIMENVRYARLDASDTEVMDACRAAAIHDKILSFPDGYAATVGERGVKLSGGELQRIAIARAILRQPKIVLLDEATSMIDAETEGLIQKAFRRLAAGRTTFVIAHRLATIQHADRICVVHDGEIVESGTHEELLRLAGRYVALWSKQLSRDVKEVGEDGSLTQVDEGAEMG